MSRTSTAQLAESGDLEGLDRRLDELALEQDWGGILELRDLSRAAIDRGHQLWPVAARAEYRLALEAPAEWAGPLLEPGAGRFAAGPLAEVAASSHTWAELAPHCPPGPAAALVAHERVLRGEDLTGDDRIDRSVLDLPLVLQPWEPDYPLAEYEPFDARFPAPDLPALEEVTLDAAPGRVVEDQEASDALRELVRAWTVESNGRIEAVAVEGSALDAVAAMGLRQARAAWVPAADAMALMAWAAASGGAHGRRRGIAAGRFAAWWATAALCGMLDDWPVRPRELGEAASELRWWVWDAGWAGTGWQLRLAVDDPADGLAWALSAADAV